MYLHYQIHSKEMNELFQYFFHFALFFLSLFLIIFFMIYNKKQSNSNKFPPGKFGWPIIGETLEFAMAGWHGNSEKFVNKRMHKYSPNVFKTSILGENMAVFCGASGNRFLFSNENQYLTTWWPRSFSQLLLFPETQLSFKEEIGIIRSFLREFLKADALKDHIPVMDSTAKEHLETYWFPHKEVKVFPLTKNFTFFLACKLFMNIKDPLLISKISAPFVVMIIGLFSLPINFPGTAFNRATKAAKIFRDELLAIVKQRNRELSEKKEDTKSVDLLSKMLLALDEKDRNLNEKEIVIRILAAVVGSYDTTSTSIASVVNYLADYPNVYKEVLREQMEIAKSKAPGELLNWSDVQKMKYTWCVICESLRLSPPAQGAFREAVTDITFAGFTIPKNWKSHWSVHSTNKNPKYFPNPEKFDPSRFEGNGPAPYTFVPFGVGPRMCPGKEYARIEILIFIHNLVTKFQWEKVIPNENIIYKPNFTPVNGLPVRLQPHRN